MNKLTNIIISGGVALFFSSCASNLTSPNQATSIPTSVSSEERGIAERVYALVNEERARAGKRALRGHGGLNTLAQKHSDHMGSSLGDVNHYGSENRAQYAYLKHSIENLSEMTYAVPSDSEDPAAETVAAWKSSVRHQKHMLQSWHHTGIGVKRGSDGNTYITMCMGAQPMGTPRSIQPVGWH